MFLIQIWKNNRDVTDEYLSDGDKNQLNSFYSDKAKHRLLQMKQLIWDNTKCYAMHVINDYKIEFKIKDDTYELFYKIVNL